MSATPADVCDTARDAGAVALAIDGSGDEAFQAALAAEARARGIPVVAVCAPSPGRGRPAPRLATADRDERRAAQAAHRSALRLCGELGATLVPIALGLLPGRHDFAKTARAFARRELWQDDADDLLARRARLSPRALDLARQGLDPLLPAAAAAGATLALANRAVWCEIPDDVEIAVLLDDFRGAPLAAWLDPAAAHARAATGFARPGETVAMLAPRAAGAWLTDASGLRGGLPWSLGEVDRAAVLSALPAAATHIVHCAPGALPHELAAALRN